MTVDTAPRPRTTTEIIGFAADDGRPLSLLHVTGVTPPTRGPVLLVHGAGVRAEIFRPPTAETIVDALLAAGYDPWLLNWRASIDFDPIPWTLDQAVLYDHPAAVREVLARTRASSVKAIVHCQGSSSFVMSAVAGLLPEVDTIISNAVSLHPVVPWFSRVKMRTVPPVISRVVPSLSPAWGDRPAGAMSRLITAGVRMTHHECDNTACRMVSFTYGSGRPALWSHENLDDATHEWLRGEFGDAPMSFFAQMAASARRGQMVASSERLQGLPEAYAADAPRTDARFVLFAGADNRCFLPESQIRSYGFLRRHRPSGDDALHVLPGYGHLDIFLGAHAARDVFPGMVSELG